MAKNQLETGPTGERVAANITAVRKRKNLSQGDVAGRASLAGRNLPVSTISKIEKLDRRVDVDDLIALALALEVTPAELLAPALGESGSVDLTPTVAKTAAEARAWMSGDLGQSEAARRLVYDLAMDSAASGEPDYGLADRVLNSGLLTLEQVQNYVRVRQATAARRKANYEAMKGAVDGE